MLSTLVCLLVAAAPIETSSFAEEEVPQKKLKFEPQEELVMNDEEIEEIVFDDAVDDEADFDEED